MGLTADQLWEKKRSVNLKMQQYKQHNLKHKQINNISMIWEQYQVVHYMLIRVPEKCLLAGEGDKTIYEEIMTEKLTNLIKKKKKQ